MDGLAYVSYKHRRDQELLNQLSQAIFVLKVQAQGRLADYGLQPKDAQTESARLVDFLTRLAELSRLMSGDPRTQDVDSSYLGLARRFVDQNPDDVQDRVEELDKLLLRLSDPKRLRDRDYQLLDRLQAYLEEETAAAVRPLYRL